MEPFLLPLLGKQRPVLKLQSPVPARRAQWNVPLGLKGSIKQGSLEPLRGPSSAEKPLPTQLRPPGLAHRMCLTRISYGCHCSTNNCLLSTSNVLDLVQPLKHPGVPGHQGIQNQTQLRCSENKQDFRTAMLSPRTQSLKHPLPRFTLTGLESPQPIPWKSL